MSINVKNAALYTAQRITLGTMEFTLTMMT